MSRAGIRLQSRLRSSFRAWPYGVADSWEIRFATPQASMPRAFGAYQHISYRTAVWKSLFQDHPKGVWRIIQFRPIKGN